MPSSVLGGLPLIRKKWQAHGAALWHPEASLWGHAATGCKAGGDGAGVLLLGLRYPPPQQVALLVIGLHMQSID